MTFYPYTFNSSIWQIDYRLSELNSVISLQRPQRRRNI